MTADAVMMADTEVEETDAARESGFDAALADLVARPDAKAFATAADSRAWILAQTPQSWLGFLGHYNPILRGNGTATDDFFGAGDSMMMGGVDGELAPVPADKPAALTRGLRAMQAIARDATLDDRAAMRRIACTAAGTILFLHCSENGNGRLARFTSFLLDQDVDLSTPSSRDRLRSATVDGSLGTAWVVDGSQIDPLLRGDVFRQEWLTARMPESASMYGLSAITWNEQATGSERKLQRLSLDGYFGGLAVQTALTRNHAFDPRSSSRVTNGARRSTCDALPIVSGRARWRRCSGTIDECRSRNSTTSWTRWCAPRDRSIATRPISSSGSASISNDVT